MRERELQDVADGLARVTKEFLCAKIAPLEQRLALLEATVAERASTAKAIAPSKPRVRHRGAWASDVEYAACDGVLHKGQAFVCGCNSVRSGPPDSDGRAVWRRLDAPDA